MNPSDFALVFIASLADIRAALWALVTAVSVTAATILVHGLLTRPRKAKR